MAMLFLVKSNFLYKKTATNEQYTIWIRDLIWLFDFRLETIFTTFLMPPKIPCNYKKITSMLLPKLSLSLLIARLYIRLIFLFLALGWYYYYLMTFLHVCILQGWSWSSISYRVFHRFGHAKFSYGGPVLGLSKFLLLPQLPQKWCLLQKWSKSTQK